MIPKHKHHQEETTDAWLMSYADMITLLMCFFIIFVSVSEPKRDKFAKITQGLANKFGSVDLSTPFSSTVHALEGLIEQKRALRDVSIEKSERGIEIEMTSSAFFAGDTAELNPAMLPLLNDMAATLKQVDFLQYSVTIESHASDAALKTEAYATGWELTAARSARLVRFLIEQGFNPASLSAAGFGDSRPKVPNKDATGKAIPANQMRNERIVLRLERVK